ncbi:MAG TPA: protein kinase [Polyangia bacterium]|jgi:serine/threonine-protein kinase|nr:protein kinase [Polyangia bacterium]
MVPSPVDPLVGRVLGGRYRLTERLGQGGMGTVYRAVHTLMDKPVALKVLRADVAGDPEAALRFHREARSASRLDHEHCIRVTDFGQSEDGLLFLVMELLDGESLSARITRGPIEPRQAATIMLAVAQALVHAHEHDIIHRDLKPDNVFLVKRRDRYQVKVLDFGLAKILHESMSSHALTRTGMVYGTPEYMAPEQAQGEALDLRTDIYACGVMLYQMLTGELPFSAPSLLVLLSKHVQEVPVAPRLRAPDRGIPEELDALVMRCLEKSPAARFPSAEALAEALLPFAEPTTSSLSVPAPASTGSGPMAPTRVAATPMPAVARSEGMPPPAAGGALSPARPLPATSAAAGGEAIASVAAPVAMTEANAEAPPAGRGRKVALALGVFLVVGGILIGVGLHRRRAAPPAPTVPQDNAPLEMARRLLNADDLESAERILRRERGARDGTDLQLLLGDLEERQGNRLGALAHLHRATQLAPKQPDPHARLGALLALLGQREAACREVKMALDLDGKNSIARATAAAAGCKEP